MTETLRDVAGLAKSIRNFENWLGGAEHGAMDIDCCVERKGHVLFIEGKPWQKGIPLNFGQHLTLSTLSKQPSTTVLLVGEDGPLMHLYELGASRALVSRRKGRLTAWYWPELFVHTDVDGLRAYVGDWWRECSV